MSAFLHSVFKRTSGLGWASLLVAWAILTCDGAHAQQVAPGPHPVGFRVLEATLSADRDTVDEAGRTRLPVYLWYPAREATGRPMPYGDYLALTQMHKRGSFDAITDADREAAADLPRGIAQHAFGQPLTDAQWQAIYDRTTTARRDADPAPGPFPLVLGGLNGAQSVATLAEHLASHGYVVASGPMPRAVARQQRAAPLQAVAALSDILDTVLATVAPRPSVDTSRIGLVGVNFDGYTVLDYQMETGWADAVLTLDGREGKAGGTATTRSLPHFDPARLRVPYLAFEMDAPDEPQFHPDEAFFEDLRFADGEAVVLDGVEHFHYIGDLLAWPHLRAEVEPLYAVLYDRVLRFLDAHVREASRAGADETEAQETGHAPSEGVELYYHTYGEGPPVLLLNGGPGLSSVHFVPLAKQISALGDGYRVVLFDQRGTGRSPLSVTDSSTVTVDRMVEDIEALRTHLGIERWTVMGHSWGGMYGMVYATRHADRMRGLILSSSGGADLDWLGFVGANLRFRLGPERRAIYERSFDPAYQALDPERAEQERIEAMAAAYVFDPDNIPLVVEALSREGANFPAVRRLVYADLRRTGYDLYDELAAFEPPALVLHGRQDLLGDLTPFRTHQALANSTLVWLDECSHYGWLDRPEAYFAAIRHFLTDLSG